MVANHEFRIRRLSDSHTQLSTIAPELAGAYADYYRNPKLSVFVQHFANLNVYVTGEVAKPGVIQLQQRLTAVQAIIEAGGLLKTAKVGEAVVLRKLESKTPVTIHLHLNEVLDTGIGDTVLQYGDVVYVPESDIKVYVGGEVTRPGLIPLNGTLSVLEAIVEAGGFTEKANQNSVMLLRNNGQNKPTVTKLKFNEALGGDNPDAALQPFDVVYVPKSKIAKVNQFVDQYIRKLIPVAVTAGFSYVLGGDGR